MQKEQEDLNLRLDAPCRRNFRPSRRYCRPSLTAINRNTEDDKQDTLHAGAVELRNLVFERRRLEHAGWRRQPRWRQDGLGKRLIAESLAAQRRGHIRGAPTGRVRISHKSREGELRLCRTLV